MEILFESLSAGGNVSGEALLVSPLPQMVALEQAGDHAILVAPSPSALIEAVEHAIGSVLADVRFQMVAAQRAGGTAILFAPLPTIEAGGDGHDEPDGMLALLEAPLPASTIVASTHLVGGVLGDAALPDAFIFETGIDHARLVAPLPILLSQETLVLGNRINMLQPAGYLSAYAGYLPNQTANDYLFLSDEVSVQVGPVLRDSFSLTVAAQASSLLLATMTDNLRLADAARLAWEMAVTDGFQLIDSAAGVQLVTATCADLLRLTDAADDRLTAQAAVLIGFAMADSVGIGWNADAVDTMDVAATVATLASLSENLSDGYVISDAADGAARITAMVGDALQLTDAVVENLTASQLLLDGFNLGLTLRIGQEEYFAYVLHGQPIDEFGTRPVTEYRNYAFNSFFRLGRTDHATGPGGLYELDAGEDDAGVPIEAWVRSGLGNMGSSGLKRIADVFLAIRGDADPLFIKMVHRDPSTGALTEDWFELVPAPHGAPLPTRARIARGLKSMLWGYELRNIDGRDFDLHEMRFYPLFLDKSTH